ncbi:cytochrome P450 89A2-like protein [Tanacetum coccineum]
MLTTSLLELEPILSNLKSKYGPLICLSVGPRPIIFVTSHSLAHQMLIQKGAVFSDFPETFLFPNISSASYGPTWRVPRWNLASEVVHPSRMKSYSCARKWVLYNLISRLQKKDSSPIKAIDHFQHAIYSLLITMCFGEKFDEHSINEIASVQRRLLFLLS